LILLGSHTLFALNYPVSLQLKTGETFTASVDSVFWWGFKFSDTTAVMYRQIELIQTPNSDFVNRVKRYVPAATILKHPNYYIIRFDRVQEFTKPASSQSMFTASYLVANLMTEKAEQFELQFDFIPQGAEFLVGELATSIGILHQDPATYPNSSEYSDAQIQHMVFGYTLGFGYRWEQNGREITILPVFSKKFHNVNQGGFILDDNTDVAFYLAGNYRQYFFHSRVALSVGAKWYLHNIPYQKAQGDFNFNVGVAIPLSGSRYFR